MAPGELSGRRLWVMAKGYAPDEGGMQTYARGVAEAFAELGAEVTVFTQTSIGPRRGQVGPVQVVDIGPGKGLSVPFRLIAAMRRERQRGGAPLFVHGTTWRMSVMPMLLGLRYDKLWQRHVRQGIIKGVIDQHQLSFIRLIQTAYN